MTKTIDVEESSTGERKASTSALRRKRLAIHRDADN